MNTKLGFTGIAPTTTEAEIITKHIYGMRYPDGTTNWDATYKTYENAATDDDARQQWINKLREKAQELHIDPDVYATGHVLLKRTVIVSITEAEEV